MEADTHYSTLYGTVLAQVGNYLAHYARWDGKRVTGIIACLGKDGGIYAHQLAVGVYQCTTAIAGVDGGIGLYKRFYTHLVGHVVADAACLGADNTGRYGRCQPEGVTYGQNPFAYLQIVGVAELYDGQPFGFYLYQREVGIGVGTYDAAVERPVVVEGHLYLIGTAYHVVVGYDVAVG